jgi:hypothetical protein
MLLAERPARRRQSALGLASGNKKTPVAGGFVF